MESIGSLAGGIAHDFNNILGGILGHASLMKMKVTEADPLYKSIDTIESSAMRGAELTNQLLAFSRRQKSHFKSVNLNDITLETMKIIRSTFPKSIEVETELQSDLGTIVANESQIHQIVMNLCLNARDAVNEKGIIRIKTSNIFFDAEHVRNYPDAREGRYVLFDITDNGIGMGEETVSRIFEPFYTVKEAGKGTGHDGFSETVT